MLDYNKIKSHLIDELHDVTEYMDMAELASNDIEKQFLKDIAKEERMHATYLQHILDKHSDIRLTDSEKELWDKANKAVAPM